MIFSDQLSFLYVILFIALFNFFRIVSTPKIVLSILLLVGNFIVLNTISNFTSLGILGLLSIVFFYLGKFLQSRKENKIWLALSVSFAITLFVLKNYSIAEFDLLHRIGLSYILFRIIHFLIESAKHNIKNQSLLSFCNYILFFPTFIAGPIDNYKNFDYWIGQKRKKFNVVLFKAGLFKLSIGIIKKFFLVPIIANYALDFSLFQEDFIWQESLVYSLFLYSFYILFDFSGYSDIAIGTAYLIGIRIPENFNLPYLAANLSIFWKKWHITFSDFLFKYVFKPTAIFLSKTFNKLPRLSITFSTYIITFIICGIWHGNTLNFIYWGLWHGVGLIFFKLWSLYFYNKKIAPLRNKLVKSIFQFGGIFITFLFVTVGWFFFNYSSNSIELISKNIADKKAEQFKVNTIVSSDTSFFEIVFTPQNLKTQFIDFEYTTSFNNQPILISKIPKNNQNTYYFIPDLSFGVLSQIRVKEHTANKWNSTLVYPKKQGLKQSEIQEYLFGKISSIITLKEKPKPIVGRYQLLDLPSKINNQTIIFKPKYLKKLGWCLEAKYKPSPSHKILIQYRQKGGSWKTHQDGRDGKWKFVQIHGFNEYNGTSRNIEHGEYEIRLKYFDPETNMSSLWFYQSCKLEKYD